MDQDLTILSPEKTILSYRLAGLGSRVIAHVIDLICVSMILILGGQAIYYLIGQQDPGLAQGLILFLIGTVPFLYFILLEGLWNGQTIGKVANGIRVRMVDGTPVTFLAAMGRNLLRPADMLPGPYLLGLLSIFTNPRSQRIGDLVAGTVVCYERRTMPLFSSAPHMVGVHPLEEKVGDLQGMTSEEYDALKRLCDRFPQLSPAIQNKLLGEVWVPFTLRRKVPNPPNIHPLYLAEAVVMKYGRQHGRL